MTNSDIGIIISLIAIITSISTIFVLYKNRLETNRPIVTVLLESDAGTITTSLTLRVYNTGNTPALNITLDANIDDINNALDEKALDIYKNTIYKSLSKKNIIPVIHNGANVHNAFGALSKDENNTFKCKSVIPIVLKYENLYGHTYTQKQIIIIKITDNFADSGWK